MRSADINAFIQEVTGGDFTAKDFRTWNATVLAAVALAVSTEATAPTARKRAVTRAMQEVAHYLGNTPAVCRASYVDPRVVDAYRGGATIKTAPCTVWARERGSASSPTQGAIERAVLRLLEDASDHGRRRRGLSLRAKRLDERHPHRSQDQGREQVGNADLPELEQPQADPHDQDPARPR